MTPSNQLFAFLAVVLTLGVITYLLLGTANNPEHQALTAFVGFWDRFPVRIVGKGLFGAVGAMLLYPVLLRPVVITAYKRLPPWLRFVPRNFIAASNLRLLLLSLVFAAMSGVLLSIGLRAITSQSVVTEEFVIGLYTLLVGLLLLNMQYQFAYIRASLKKSDLLESFLAIVHLLTGSACIGHAFVA